MVENLPASARDTDLIPDLGRSHMLQSSQAHVPQLSSPCAETTETRVPKSLAMRSLQEKALQKKKKKKRHCSEKPVLSN